MFGSTGAFDDGLAHSALCLQSNSSTWVDIRSKKGMLRDVRSRAASRGVVSLDQARSRGDAYHEPGDDPEKDCQRARH